MKKKNLFLILTLFILIISCEMIANAGWKKDNIGWWWQYDDGTYPIYAFKYDNGEWYWFDERGYMVTGWREISGYWYYFSPSGAMQMNTWIGDYYVGSEGKMLTNQWINEYFVGLDGKWIPNYQMPRWVNVGGRWWYKHYDGSYTTNNWEFIDGKWYYFDADGWMMSNCWIESGGYWYYLLANGEMATLQWIGNYYVDLNGAWIPGYDYQQHTHKWQTRWEITKSGYACNGCITDVTDWDDKYACHGGWHSHQWWLTPYTETCTSCGVRKHLHEWTWREPDYYVGTDEIASGNYYICFRCGHKSLDGQTLVQELREKYWISGFDFTNTNYIIGVKSVEPKSDPMKLQSIRVDHKPIVSSNLVIGEELNLSVTYTPASTNQKGVIWSSSNSAVLSVDSNGKVKALSEGTASIEIKSKYDSTKTHSFTFNVYKNKEGEVNDAWVVIDGQKIENNGTFVCQEGGWINGQKEVKYHEIYVVTNPNPAKYKVKYNYSENEEFADEDPHNYYVMRLGDSAEFGNWNQYIYSEDTVSKLVSRDAGTCTFRVDITDCFGKKITLKINVIVEER